MSERNWPYISLLIFASSIYHSASFSDLAPQLLPIVASNFHDRSCQLPCAATAQDTLKFAQHVDFGQASTSRPSVCVRGSIWLDRVPGTMMLCCLSSSAVPTSPMVMRLTLWYPDVPFQQRDGRSRKETHVEEEYQLHKGWHEGGSQGCQRRGLRGQDTEVRIFYLARTI